MLTVKNEDESSTCSYSIALTPSYGLVARGLQLIVSDPSFFDFEAYPSHASYDNFYAFG